MRTPFAADCAPFENVSNLRSSFREPMIRTSCSATSTRCANARRWSRRNPPSFPHMRRRACPAPGSERAAGAPDNPQPDDRADPSGSCGPCSRIVSAWSGSISCTALRCGRSVIGIRRTRPGRLRRTVTLSLTVQGNKLKERIPTRTTALECHQQRYLWRVQPLAG